MSTHGVVPYWVLILVVLFRSNQAQQQELECGECLFRSSCENEDVIAFVQSELEINDCNVERWSAVCINGLIDAGVCNRLEKLTNNEKHDVQVALEPESDLSFYIDVPSHSSEVLIEVYGGSTVNEETQMILEVDAVEANVVVHSQEADRPFCRKTTSGSSYMLCSFVDIFEPQAFDQSAEVPFGSVSTPIATKFVARISLNQGVPVEDLIVLASYRVCDEVNLDESLPERDSEDDFSGVERAYVAFRWTPSWDLTQTHHARSIALRSDYFRSIEHVEVFEHLADENRPDVNIAHGVDLQSLNFNGRFTTVSLTTPIVVDATENSILWIVVRGLVLLTPENSKDNLDIYTVLSSDPIGNDSLVPDWSQIEDSFYALPFKVCAAPTEPRSCAACLDATGGVGCLSNPLISSCVCELLGMPHCCSESEGGWTDECIDAFLSSSQGDSSTTCAFDHCTEGGIYAARIEASCSGGTPQPNDQSALALINRECLHSGQCVYIVNREEPLIAQLCPEGATEITSISVEYDCGPRSELDQSSSRLRITTEVSFQDDDSLGIMNFDCSGIQVQHAFIGQECGVDGAQHADTYRSCVDKFRCHIVYEGENVQCSTEGPALAYEVRYFCGGDPSLRSHFEISHLGPNDGLSFAFDIRCPLTEIFSNAPTTVPTLSETESAYYEFTVPSDARYVLLETRSAVAAATGQIQIVALAHGGRPDNSGSIDYFDRPDACQGAIEYVGPGSNFNVCPVEQSPPDAGDWVVRVTARETGEVVQDVTLTLNTHYCNSFPAEQRVPPSLTDANVVAAALFAGTWTAPDSGLVTTVELDAEFYASISIVSIHENLVSDNNGNVPGDIVATSGQVVGNGLVWTATLDSPFEVVSGKLYWVALRGDLFRTGLEENSQEVVEGTLDPGSSSGEWTQQDSVRVLPFTVCYGFPKVEDCGNCDASSGVAGCSSAEVTSCTCSMSDGESCCADEWTSACLDLFFETRVEYCPEAARLCARPGIHVSRSSFQCVEPGALLLGATSRTAGPQRVANAAPKSAYLLQLETVSEMCDGMVECDFEVVEGLGTLAPGDCSLFTEYECSELAGEDFVKTSSDFLGSIASLNCYGINVFDAMTGPCDDTDAFYEVCSEKFECEFNSTDISSGGPGSDCGDVLHLTYTCGADMRRTEYIVNVASATELVSISCPLPPSPIPTPSPTNHATATLENDKPLTNVRFAPAFPQRAFSFEFYALDGGISDFEVYVYPVDHTGPLEDIFLSVTNGDGDPLSGMQTFPDSGAALYRARNINSVSPEIDVVLSTEVEDSSIDYVVHMKYETCTSATYEGAVVEREPELMTVALPYENRVENPNLIRRIMLRQAIGPSDEQPQFQSVFDVMLYSANPSDGSIDLSTPVAPCGSFEITRDSGDWHVDTRSAKYEAAEHGIWIVIYGNIAPPLYTNQTGLGNITTLIDRTSLSACEPDFEGAVEEEISWSAGLCIGAVFDRGCGDCHVAHDEPFCSNRDLANCVCNTRDQAFSYCCETGGGWNASCVDALFQVTNTNECGGTFDTCVEEITEIRYRSETCDPNILDEMCPDHNRLCDAGSSNLEWMRCGVARDYVLRSVDNTGSEQPICGTLDQCWVDVFGSTDEVGFKEYSTTMNCFACCFRHELDNTFDLSTGVCGAFPISPCCDADIYNASSGNIVGNACRLRCNQGEPCGEYQPPIDPNSQVPSPVPALCDDLVEPECEECCLGHDRWRCSVHERSSCDVCGFVEGFRFLGEPIFTETNANASAADFDALVQEYLLNDQCAGMTLDEQSGTLSFFPYGSGYEKTDDQTIRSARFSCPNDLLPPCTSSLSSLDRCPAARLAPECRNASGVSLYVLCEAIPECFNAYQHHARAGGLTEATCRDADSCWSAVHARGSAVAGYREFIDLYICWQCCTHNKPIEDGTCQGRNGLAGLFEYKSEFLFENARLACESAYPDAVGSPTSREVCMTNACDDCGERSYHLHTDPTCFNESGTGGLHWNLANTAADLDCGWEPCEEVLVSYNGGLDWCSSCFDMPCEDLTPSPTMSPTPSPTSSPALGFVTCRLGNVGAQIMCQFNSAINFQPNAGQFNAVTLCTRVLAGDEGELRSLYGVGRTCAFLNKGVFTIRFGQQSTIEIGAEITFLIGPSGSDDSTVSTAILGAPLKPVRPIAKISGPSLTSTCAELRLNGLQSTGGAGRQFTEFVWNVSDPGNVTTALLRMLVRGEEQAQLTIDAAALTPNTNLNISLRVVNWLGVSSVRTFHTVAVSPESIPVVTGTSPIIAEPTTFTYLRANVDLKCNDTVRSYRWRALSETEATPDGFQPTRTLELTRRQVSNGAVLRMLPNTLEPSERYAFELEAVSTTGSIGRGYFGVEVRGPTVYAVSSTSRSVCIGEGCPPLQFRSANQFSFSPPSVASSAEYFWRCTYIDANDESAEDGRDCFSEETSETLFGPREVCNQSHASFDGISIPTDTPVPGTESVVAVEWITPDTFGESVASDGESSLHTLKQLHFPSDILTSFARVGLFTDNFGVPRQQLTCSDSVFTADNFHTVTFDSQVELETGSRYWIVLTQALLKNATVNPRFIPVPEASRMLRIYHQPTLRSADGDSLCEASSWNATLNPSAVQETDFVLPFRFCTDAPLPLESRANIVIPQSVLASEIPGGTLTFSVFLGDSILEEYPSLGSSDDDSDGGGLPVAELRVTTTRTTVAVPQVIIIPLPTRKVSTGLRVALEVIIEYAGSFDDLTYQWTSLSGNFDLSNGGLLLSDATSRHLVFRRNALEPGVEYQFEVAVFVGTADSANFASATINFETNYPPTGGTCELLIGGRPLRASYTFACSGWTDDADDMPLVYRFLLNPGRPRQVLLSQWSPLSEVQAFLPPGNHTIEAQIRDNLGATTRSRIQLSIPRIDFDDSNATSGNTATQFASDIVSQLLAYGESLSNSSAESQKLLSLDGIRLQQDDEGALTSEEAVQLIVGVADLLSENPTNATDQANTRSGLRSVMFFVLDQVTFETDATDSNVDDAASQTSDELEQFLQVAAAVSGTPSELEALRQSLPDFLERVLSVALSGTYAMDGVTDAIANSALETLSQSGAAPYNETIDEAQAFIRSFDDVVYQIARGSVRDTFAGEEGKTIESGNIRLFSRRTRADQIDGLVFLDTGNSTSDGLGSVIAIPTGTIFANANLVNGSQTTIDFAFVSYNETVFPTTGNPAAVKGDDGVQFDLLTNQIASLSSISETVQVNYYDAAADIDPLQKNEYVVSNLDPCDPIQIRIQHDVANDNVESLANFDSAGALEGTVCRHWDENSTELLSDCVRHNFTREYTVCNCTHLTFFDVAGVGDFVPSANLLTVDDFKAVTIENLRRHPSGWMGLAMVTGVFILLFSWASYRDWRVYKEAMGRKRGKPLKKLKMKNKTTLIGSKLVADDDYQWIICHDERLSARQKINKVWTFRLKNKHKWVGLFLHKKRSRFQKKERATVLYVYIMSTLAIGAVFHGQKESVADYISIGLISSLFALVPSLLTSQLFMNSRSRLQAKAFGKELQNVRKSIGRAPTNLEDELYGTSAEEVPIDGSAPANLAKGSSEGRVYVEMTSMGASKKRKSKPCTLTKEDLLSNLDALSDGGRPPRCLTPDCEYGVVGAHPTAAEEARKHKRGFFSILFSGILDSEMPPADDIDEATSGKRDPFSGRKEGEGNPNSDRDNTKGTFSPRMKKYTYAFSFLWSLACAGLVLVYSIQFDREIVTFYTQCGQGELVESRILDWGYSIAIANLTDIFISQPFSLLLLSVFVVMLHQCRGATEEELEAAAAAANRPRLSTSNAARKAASGGGAMGVSASTLPPPISENAEYLSDLDSDMEYSRSRSMMDSKEDNESKEGDGHRIRKESSRNRHHRKRSSLGPNGAEAPGSGRRSVSRRSQRDHRRRPSRSRSRSRSPQGRSPPSSGAIVADGRVRTSIAASRQATRSVQRRSSLDPSRASPSRSGRASASPRATPSRSRRASTSAVGTDEEFDC